MCLYSKYGKNKKYTANKKNGGVIPAVLDERVKYVPYACGLCIECRKAKAREWQIRLLEDIKEHKNGKFITLTLSDEWYAELAQEIKGASGYLLDNQIATLACRRYLERVRKRTGKSVRHFYITELGHNGTKNIHMHGILWTDDSFEIIEKDWKYGYIWPRKEDRKKPNYVNNKTINYIIKYITKVDFEHKLYKPIILTSAGIGKRYIKSHDANNNKFKEEKTNEAYRTSTGHKINLPVYWRNYIYTEEEREKLWLQKLDKEERYVGGEKVSIKNGLEEYEKLKEYYRQKNERLGYGGKEIDHEKKVYEMQQRAIMQLTRIKKGLAKKAQKERSKAASKIKKNNNKKEEERIIIGNGIWKKNKDGLVREEAKQPPSKQGGSKAQ